MGGFYKDKDRAEIVLRRVLSRTTEAFDLDSLTVAVQAESGLKVGSTIVERLLKVMLYKNEVVYNGGFYRWRRAGVAE